MQSFTALLLWLAITTLWTGFDDKAHLLKLIWMLVFAIRILMGNMRLFTLTIEELRALVHAISHRVVRFLEKRGFLERDADDCMDAGGRVTHGAVTESSYLALEPDDDDAIVQLQGHSITYRIAVGPQQGPKVFTLQTLPPDEDSPGGSDRVAKEAAG